MVYMLRYTTSMKSDRRPRRPVGEKAVFRRGRRCMEYIFVMRQLV